MIEVIIKYIQDKGFLVDVIPAFENFPGVLVIRKYLGDELCSLSWAIPKHELQPQLEQALYWEADRYMAQINRAIAEKQGQLTKGH